VKTRRLDQLASFTSGGTPSRSDPDNFRGDIPWITGADIGDRFRITPRSFITEGAVAKSAVNVVPPGTLLLVTRTSVGKVTIADRTLGFSQDITALQHDPSEVDGTYLALFLQSVAHRLASAARGATIKGVQRRDVAEIDVPLPPLPEQRRIAAILDQADELRTKRRQALTLLDELRASVTGEFLEQQSTDSDIRTIREVASLVTKGTTPTSLGYAYTDGGVPFLRVQDLTKNSLENSPTVLYVSDETHDALARSKIIPGDVLLSIAGTIGRTAVVPVNSVEMNCNQAVAIIRPNEKILSVYLGSWLDSTSAKSQIGLEAVTATIANLSLGVISKLKLPLPTIARQRELVLKLEELEKVKGDAIKSLNAFEELFASLQHRAFRGEL
jgi:type I restriction enzyme S subunit